MNIRILVFDLICSLRTYYAIIREWAISPYAVGKKLKYLPDLWLNRINKKIEE